MRSPEVSRTTRRAVYVVTLGILISCGDHPRSEANNRDSLRSRSPAVAVPESIPTPPRNTLARVAWRPFDHPRQDATDLGTGLVALTIDVYSNRVYPLEDTLVFRAEPKADAAVVGALIVERPERTTWRFAALLPPGVQPNFLTYRYDEGGVPTDSADASGRWVRGILGFTANGTALLGWASLDTKRAVSLSWIDAFDKQIPSFLETSQATLYSTLADAEAAHAGEPPPKGDYEFEEVLERRGQWLRVRMRWPYDSCYSRKEGTESREVWIRYLDDRGRPLVFYRTGTC